MFAGLHMLKQKSFIHSRADVVNEVHYNVF